MLLENRVSRDMPVYAIIHFSYLSKFFLLQGLQFHQELLNFFRIGLGPMIGFFLSKIFSLVFYLQNNQKYKGTDEEDLLEDQEVDNQHYDANGHSLLQPPHDETDQENLSQQPHTVRFFARLVSFSKGFLRVFSRFPELFENILAIVDLQTMKIQEMVSAFCTYFQNAGLLTLAASRDPNPRLLSIQKLQFQSFLASRQPWILASKGYQCQKSRGLKVCAKS